MLRFCGRRTGCWAGSTGRSSEQDSLSQPIPPPSVIAAIPRMTKREILVFRYNRRTTMTSESEMRAKIERIDANTDNIRYLREDVADSGVTPFVGAGISIPFGFEGWGAFLQRYGKRFGVGTQVKSCISAGLYEEAASACLAASGPEVFQDALHSGYGPHRLNGIERTRTLALLPRLARDGPVVTTNFDSVLETAFSQASNSFVLTVIGADTRQAIDVLRSRKHCLLKIHGDVMRPNDRVLTREEYDRQYGTSSTSIIDFERPLPRFLQMVVLIRPVLFIGCSLASDRVLTVMGQIQKLYPELRNYAFVQQPSSRDAFEARKKQLHNSGILRPIWFPYRRYECIEFLLSWIIDQRQPASSQAVSLGPSRESRDMRYLNVSEYRKRCSHSYDRWDLRNVSVSEAGVGPVLREIKLEEIYQELRLGHGYDVLVDNRGAIVSPLDVVSRDRPLLIRGPAGCGKTTWMRWTFRKLLTQHNVVPIFVELRKLARYWSQPPAIGRVRSLDFFLQEHFREHGCDAEVMLETLKTPQELAPVLLIDSWDEVGQLGDELHDKLLGFMHSFPHVSVVAASRPYGNATPSYSDNFEVLDVQPLSPEDIKAFARRFFEICYGRDERAANQYLDGFCWALNRSREAASLAKTPLLLTMMLIANRGSPLPEKRHRLYEQCVKNLVMDLPVRREEEGVLPLSDEWWPDDADDRLRITSELAYKMQSQMQERKLVVLSRSGMTGFLPDSWDGRKRYGFLTWLTRSSGLFLDRIDDSVSFAHLSFQEFLAAWYIYHDIDDASARLAACLLRLDSPAWWETLRLWAALEWARKPTNWQPVLDHLVTTSNGLCLAGAMFADGLGATESCDAWALKFSERLRHVWPAQAAECADAWANCRQIERRESVEPVMKQHAANSNWLARQRYEEFTRRAGFTIGEQSDNLETKFIVHSLKATPESDREFAVGRILCGGEPNWPADFTKVGLLQLWPSRRRLLGLRMQLCATLVSNKDPIADLLSTFLRPTLSNADSNQDMVYALATELLGSWMMDTTRTSPMYLASDWSKSMARLLVESLPRIGRREAIETGRIVGDWWARYWVGHGRRPSPASWAREVALSPRAKVSGLRTLEREYELRWIELRCLGWGMAHVAAAHFLDDQSSESQLLIEASRLYLRPEQSAAAFEAALENYGNGNDALWPALARHIARRSTVEDRSLLVELAEFPERRPAPMQWGLKYIVRGDVVLPDGSEITIDSITDRLAYSRYPYLDEMPGDFLLDIAE